jgi:hypothetical protein
MALNPRKLSSSCEISGFPAASMKFRVFWDVLPFSKVDVDRRFRGAYGLHDQGGLSSSRC